MLWQLTGVLLGLVFGLPDLGWTGLLWALWAGCGLQFAADRWFPRHEARILLDGLAAMLHNVGMLVIAVQVCFIYATAGWYKIQGSRWQDGSALHYALNLDHFRPWPALSDLLVAGMIPVVLLAYATVAVQVAFPFTLASRKIKNALLAVMMTEHAAIAIVLGLPFLSAAMIVCDALFLPTALLLGIDARVRRSGLRPRGGSEVPAAIPAVPGPTAENTPPPHSTATADPCFRALLPRNGFRELKVAGRCRGCGEVRQRPGTR